MSRGWGASSHAVFSGKKHSQLVEEGKQKLKKRDLQVLDANYSAFQIGRFSLKDTPTSSLGGSPQQGGRSISNEQLNESEWATATKVLTAALQECLGVA